MCLDFVPYRFCYTSGSVIACNREQFYAGVTCCSKNIQVQATNTGKRSVELQSKREPGLFKVK